MKFVWRYIWNKMRDIGNEPEKYEANRPGHQRQRR